MFTHNANLVFIGELFTGISSQFSKNVVSYGGSNMADFYNHSAPSQNISYLMSEFASVTTLSDKRSSAGSSYGVLFGSGNAEPKADDYCLSGEAIDGLGSSNITSVETSEVDDDHLTVTRTYTITNTTGNDITIGEVGLVYYLQAYTSATSTGSSYKKYWSYLVERSKLDSPITIPAGGVGQVVYSIRMNYPV